MRLNTIIAVLVVLVFITGAYGQGLKSKTAPEFSLKDVNGKKVTLSDYFGKGPIYISFWATWCKPCREELKIIQELYEKYGDQGFTVFAINTEGPREIGKVKSFAVSNGWTFDVLLDENGEVFKRRYKGFAHPYTVMTDPEGNIIFTSVGFVPGDEKRVEELIRQYTPQPDSGKSETEPEG